jgi:hypothetical protein
MLSSATVATIRRSSTTVLTCVAITIMANAARVEASAPSSQVVYGQQITNHRAAVFSPGGNAALRSLASGGPGLETIGPDGTFWTCTQSGTLIAVPAKTTTLFGVAAQANRAMSLVPAGALSPSVFSQQVGECFGTFVDSAGNLYMTNWTSNSITVIPTKTTTLYGQRVTANTPTTFNPGGTGRLGTLLNTWPAQNPKNPSVLQAGAPDQIVEDASGNLFIAVQGPDQVIVIAKKRSPIFGQAFLANTPSVLAAATAGIYQVDSLGFDNFGDLLIGDYNATPTSSETAHIGVLAASTHKLFGQRLTANTFALLNPGGHGALTKALGSGGGGQFVFTKAGDLLAVAYTQGVLVAIPGPSTHRLFGQGVSPSTPVRLNPWRSGLSDLLQGSSTCGLVLSAPGSLLISNQGQPGRIIVLAGP